MTTVVPQPLLRLFELSRVISKDTRGDKMSSFGAVGLFLYPAFDYPTYINTPKNSATFASTGGDGVHYGFLCGGEFSEIDPPIVMTVPMNFDLPNIIVGSNLNEFLSLGCRYGYFGLEQIAYDPLNTLHELRTGVYDPDCPDEEIGLLKTISAEFEVTPWADPEARLNQLRLKYHALLELPDLDDGAA